MILCCCVKLEKYVFTHKTHAHFVPIPTHSLWGNNSVMFYIGRGMDTGQQCAGLWEDNYTLFVTVRHLVSLG